MTAAEQRKLAQEARHKFINDAARIVSVAVVDLLPRSGRQTSIQLTAKNYNRYFNLHRYGDDLAIKIYWSGEIDMTLKEFCHNDVTVRLVHYDKAAPEPEAALSQFQEEVTRILEDYITGDWHTLMDFMSQQLPGQDGIDWRDAEQTYRTELIEADET